jgi:hypothetical protein
MSQCNRVSNILQRSLTELMKFISTEMSHFKNSLFIYSFINVVIIIIIIIIKSR